MLVMASTGGPIEAGVIKTGEQVDSAEAGGGEADAESSGSFRIGAGHEGGRHFMMRLDEANAVLPYAQRFHDAIAWQGENRVDLPVDQRFDEDVGGG